METIERSVTEKPKWRKIFSVAHLNLFLVLLLIGFSAYTLFAPIVPAKYSRPVIKNANEVVAGKVLTYTMESCRYVGDAVVTTVTRKLVSTTDKSLVPITLSADTVTNPARCLNLERSVVVPFGAPAGNYQLVITGVYQVIPLRKPITVQASSDSFNLREPSEEDVKLYNQLQISPTVGGSSSTDPKQYSNSGGSSAPNTQNSQQPVTNNTTNNTTTNNTTNNVSGNGSGKEPGLIQSILENLPFGL